MISLEKTIPSGRLHMRPLQSEDNLYIQSGYPSICATSSQGSSSVVCQYFILKELCTIPSEGAQSTAVHRYFPKGSVCSMEASNRQWSVMSGTIKVSHFHSRANNSVFSFIIVQNSPLELKFVDFHSQFISGCLSEQAWMHPLSGNVCLNLENRGLNECQEESDSVKTHSRES